MEVMRVPPYPLVTTWTLPDANYDYIVYVEDLVDHSIEETTITSDAPGKVKVGFKYFSGKAEILV